MSARPRSLREVADLLSEAGLLVADPPAGIEEVTVRDLTTDSRRVARGALFCAVRGTTADGHDHAAAAVAAGTSAVLLEHDVPGLGVPALRVSSGRRAAGIVAGFLFDHPWRSMTVLGVTGTNGKTTTVHILRHLLAGEGPSASIGTLGAIGPDGHVLPGTEGLTTPGPADIARTLRRLADAGARAVSLEVSSHALHQARVGEVRFDAAVFTNLSRDHLDYHHTLDAYRAAKLTLLEACVPGGVVALNADDPAWEQVAPPDRTVLRFGLSPRADVRATGIEPVREGTRFTLATSGGAADVLLPLTGEFNVSNALAAAAALHGLGWQTGRIAERLEATPQVPGRLERVPTPPGTAAVFVDYAHTPDAMAGVLTALRRSIPGRIVLVFGAGGDRDAGKRPEMGQVAAHLADVRIVTSDNPRTEDPARIADQVAEGLAGVDFVRILDRREAIRHALSVAGPDDLVLLVGKGHETYQEIGGVRHPFDDRQVAREMVAETGGTG